MLIRVNNEYIESTNIVRVVKHPAARAICICMVGGAEVRVEMTSFETHEEALSRVVCDIQEKIREQSH